MPISYAPTSWNPVLGCEPVSEGCKNCWAMKLHAQRHNANCHVAAGAVMGRLPAPKARAADVPLPMPAQYDLPFSHIQLRPARLSEPLHWWKPRTVAVCFMGDLFWEHVPTDFVVRVFEIMAMASRHTFLLLTKRPERMRRILAHGFDPALQPWPLPNVWLGVTAENQRMADERIPLLLDTPGNHWVSLEPLLGPVDLTRIMGNLGDRVDLRIDTLLGRSTGAWHGRETAVFLLDPKNPRLDWVVVGGESGPGHRPMPLEWAADIYDQCRAANVPYYFKQRAASRPGQPSGVAALDGAKELPWTR
jgi:protein gp37